MKTRVYISLGSNMAEPEKNLVTAIAEIKKLAGVFLLEASNVYYTEPQGLKEQAWFANQVICVECEKEWLAPNLLKALLEIENKMGRVRLESQRFGPRVIDLDILLFGEQIINEQHCQIPHYLLKERAFVLVPLQDIAPWLILPCGVSVKEALFALSYNVKNNFIYQ